MPQLLCFGPPSCRHVCPFKSQTARRKLKSAAVSTPVPVLVHCALEIPALVVHNSLAWYRDRLALMAFLSGWKPWKAGHLKVISMQK
jgi:hypothetical protein